MNDSTFSIKEVVRVAKLFPLIYLCVAADFLLVSIIALINDINKETSLLWIILTLKLAFYIAMKIFFKFKKKSLQTLLHEFLAIATIAQISNYLAITTLAKGDISSCCDTFISISSMGSAILFFLWGVALLISRINILSKSGFYSLVVILALTIYSIADLEAIILTAIFSLPFMVVFIWTLATRKGLYNQSGTDESDFVFSFGYKRGSTGMKN